MRPDDLQPITTIPIPMILHCPRCHQQHIDEPDPSDNWENPPHKSHKCVGPEGCGCVWRPADIPTMGVKRIGSAGEKDNWHPDLT